MITDITKLTSPTDIISDNSTGLIVDYVERVIDDGGVVEGEDYLKDFLDELTNP